MRTFVLGCYLNPALFRAGICWGCAAGAFVWWHS